MSSTQSALNKQQLLLASRQEASMVDTRARVTGALLSVLVNSTDSGV